MLIRRFARLCAAFAAAMFWGSLISVAAKFLFSLSDGTSFFLIALPIAAGLAVFFWRKMPPIGPAQP